MADTAPASNNKLIAFKGKPMNADQEFDKMNSAFNKARSSKRGAKLMKRGKISPKANEKMSANLDTGHSPRDRAERGNA